MRARGVNADILVVGLGPAGAAAAGTAAAAGARVVAIDARAMPGYPVQCAEFVPAALEADLPWLAEVTVQPIRQMRTFVESAPPDVTAGFPGCMIDRAAFDRRLADDAARAGARLLSRRRIGAIGTDGTLVSTTGEMFRARVVIGADGPRSAVGAATGRVNTALVETRQLMVDLRSKQDSTDIFLSASYPGGYGWLFPKAGMANLGLGLAARDRARLKPLLAGLHARLSAQGTVGRAAWGLTGGAIPVGGRHPVAAWCGSIPMLLAGDALGLANPVTGAGIAAAVLSGRLVGGAALAWVGGDRTALELLEEDIALLFDSSLRRAQEHRRALDNVAVEPDSLRAHWIADPRYWTKSATEHAL